MFVLVYRLINSVMTVGKSGALSGKAKGRNSPVDWCGTGMAKHNVQPVAMETDDNAASGVIWLARSHDYL